MKETSKNCVSDYPLSNTESAERGVAFFAIGTSGVLLRMCVPQSGSQSRAAGSVRALPVALSRGCGYP
jgi:hypothetical protein